MVDCRLKRNRGKAQCKKTTRKKLKGPWFRGDVYSGGFSADRLAKSKKYSKGVKKPAALETKKMRGRMYSRYYYKPMKLGEFYD